MVPIVMVSPALCKSLSFFFEVGAITLYPFIISKEPMDEVVLNHEKIHIRQQEELLVLGFYALYFMWWAIGMLKGKGGFQSYYEIPFEIEAYENESNPQYLEKRKRFAFRDYI